MRLIGGLLHLDGTEASEQLLHAIAAQMTVPRLNPSVQICRDGPLGFAVLDFARRSESARGLLRGHASIIAADVRLDLPIGPSPSPTEDEQLLALLDKSGPSSLSEILGDFAFGYWNSDRKILTCGRDVFGVRPLAYVHHPGRFFAFASFPAALHGSGIVQKKIDEDAVARRMTLTFRADDCLIAGIKRLPPAHYLEVSRDTIALRRYWQLDPASRGTISLAPEAAAAKLGNLISEAVKCRLPHNGKAAAHLSGGLDSSAITVIAARQLRGDNHILHTYSFLDRLRNDVSVEDETKFVQAVLEQEDNIDWTPIRPPAAMPAHDDPTDPDKMTPLGVEEPENAVCQLAERQSVDVILSGWGGDEGASFNGRGLLAELFLHGRWWRLAQEIRALRQVRGWSLSQILRGEIGVYVVPLSIVNLVKRVAMKEGNLRSSLSRLMPASVRERAANLKEETGSMGPDGRKNQYRLMNGLHLAERAEVWAQIGARHGVAFAFPLLDRRVVEFCLSLPSTMFLRGGFRRRLFRDAMEGVLPEQVRLRHAKYQPFPSRIIDMAERRSELLSLVNSYTANETVSRMIDLGEMKRQVEAFPSPEQVRKNIREGENPTAPTEMVVVSRGLAAAQYLVQHAIETSKDETL